MKSFLASCIRSRTIWFNAIVAGLLALEAAFGALQTVLPGNAYVWSSVVLAVGNAMLRTVTTQPLADK